MVPPVEDFPQMWQRPGFAELMEILHSLEVKPPTWSHKRHRSDIRRQQESLATQRKGEVTRYLSSVIKSPLSWIEDADQQEELWELASRRMSERCGRSAMGELVRSWPFGGEEATIVEQQEPFELIIKEPALTGDSLGFKTWGSSYVLAQRLPHLAATSLFGLFDESLGQAKHEVLELGSGTGLLGLAAAALWKSPVILTDLPNIIPNLKDNAEKNADVIAARGGSVKVGPLTWGGSGDDEVDPDLFGQPHQFKIVLAADPLYDDNHPALLAAAIAQHLSHDPLARAVVMVPQRDETTKGLKEALKAAMQENSEDRLVCCEEDELAGQDDWIEDEDGGHVKCWLGVFSRR